MQMRSLLSDPVMQEGLMALHDSNRPIIVSDSADALVSVRRHERGVGFDNAIAALLSLSDSKPVPTPPEEEGSYEPETT